MADSGSPSQSPVGRMKENVCGDVALKDTAMSASSLSAMSFELPASFHSSSKDSSKSTEIVDATYVSSASSTCTRESDAGTYSDADSSVNTSHHRLAPVLLDRVGSDKLNAKIALRQKSRQGRDTQRWVTEGGQTIRLVTGCVPILKGGKIMFVSASRKPEWILPKGGWELDEAMEESAVRECFEEAGVLGVLGPKLKQIEYETRKAKKRRLEQEESMRATKTRAVEKDSSEVPTTGKIAEPDAKPARIPEEQAGNASDSSSAPSSYSKVRMTLFPLYVSRVLEKWPEDGRFRKAVDIDEAMKLLDTRPELREVLEEVKSRGLHLLSKPRESIPPFADTSSS